MESATSMSNSSESVMLYSTNGHQSTGWKLAVLKAMKDDNISKHDLMREIRSERGKEGWDANTKDRHFQRIKQFVNRAVHSLERTSQFDTNVFNNFSTRESQKILNRKNAIYLQSAKK